jgi:anti-sigma regulatory factor (Ser/Thr protein kinase)
VVERQGDYLVIHIHDGAEIFDPTQVPDPDLSLPIDQRPEGKLGLFLARHSVDQMIHRAGPQGGNILTLKVKGFVNSPKERGADEDDHRESPREPPGNDPEPAR